MSENLKLSLRVLVSILCFGVIVFIVDLNRVVERLAGIELEVILMCLLVMLAGHIGSGLRFHFIITKLKRKITIIDSVKVSFVALWFNQLLPTGMGGDVVRVVMLAKSCGRIRIVLSALLDRLLGLLWMVLILSLMVPLILYERLGLVSTMIVLAICIAIMFAGLSPIWVKKNYRRLIRKSKFLAILRLYSLLGHALKIVIGPNKLYLLFLIAALSFFPYVIYMSLLGDSFGLELTFPEYLAVVPIIFIAMQFPISIGGWGVRELSSLYVFSYMGIPEETGVALSLLYGAGLLVTSIPGNLFWVNRGQVATTQDEMS